MSPHLFGTDGVRGTANLEPLTAETLLRLGRAAVRVLLAQPRADGDRHRVLVGRDTRHSGDFVEGALAAGLLAAGVDVHRAGVLPTPGVAALTREMGFDAGVAITASHNPFEDNGVKFFGPDGFKLDDEAEGEIERLVLAGEPLSPAVPATGRALGRTRDFADALDRYVALALASLPAGFRLDGVRIAVDGANGAGCHATPAALASLGADVHAFHDEPDGLNINADCGSTHPHVVGELTKETGAQLGISHDGDADRVVLCDETGSDLDGDEVLAICAADFLRRDALRDRTLVVTVMSNFGLDEFLAERSGKVLRTPVGDRHVLAAMRRFGLNLGGEQSGHFIFGDHSTTGDGLVSALQVLRIMRATGRPLSELRTELKKYPQAQRHVRVSRKPPLASLPEVSRLVAEAEKAVAGQGRVLLRYSGTEPKARLLVEGRDAAEINRHADRIAAALTEAAG